MATDSRKPLTGKEVDQLLTSCLHGPLPQGTIYRMMATLAAWAPIVTAANKWWVGLRPFHTSLRSHLQNPTHNTFSDSERVLARAVADWRKLGNK